MFMQFDVDEEDEVVYKDYVEQDVEIVLFFLGCFYFIQFLDYVLVWNWGVN